jgi:putative tryptophan/tyrosine transport system substrate-binding protein
MTRGILLVAVGLNLVAMSSAAWAQGEGLSIVGLLSGGAGPRDATVEAFRQGLRELGYVEGRNIRVEFRTAQGRIDRLPVLAEELVLLKPSVIVVGSAPAALAVKRVSSTIPIVIVAFDPVASRLVTNIAHPGGQVTGLSTMTTELHAKRLQLLKEAIPRLARIAVLQDPGVTHSQQQAVGELKAAASALAIELTIVPVPKPEEFDSSFAMVSRAHAQALYVLESPLFYTQRMALAKLALKARLPAYGPRAFAEAGGLMSYGMNYSDQARRSAGYVDKILKGAKPGDLPIEQPTKFELVVNLKTAKALGLTIPQSILLRANEVIR